LEKEVGCQRGIFLDIGWANEYLNTNNLNVNWELAMSLSLRLQHPAWNLFPYLFLVCAFSVVSCWPARAQDLSRIEGLSAEVRAVQPLACPPAGALQVPNIATYKTLLDGALTELRTLLPQLRQVASQSTLFGDSGAAVANSANTLIQALNNTDSCAAAAAFVKINPAKAQNAPQPPLTDILIAPASILFDDLEVGDKSQPKSFSITNKGTASIAIKHVSIAHCDRSGMNCGGTSAEFEVVGQPSQPCSNFLDQAAHCDVQVVFAPKYAGNFTARVNVEVIDGSGNPRPEAVQLVGQAHVTNLASLNGDGSSGTNPSMRSVVGFDISGASSAANEQKAFLEFDLNAPLGRAGKVCVKNIDHRRYPEEERCKAGYHYEARRDPLNRRLWAFFNPRITSLPQSRSAISDLNIQGFTDFFNGKTTDLVQGLDIQGGLEWLMVKPRTGMPFFSSYRNMHGRLGIALVGGAGFTTPFGTPGANPTVFTLAADSPLRQQFNVPSATFTNIAFVDKERSRFFRKYFAGLRLKTYQFTDLAKGICDPDYDRKCEGLENLFPGIIDLTMGQDEQVTAGHLSRWVFRVDAVYPLPFATSFNIFGSVNTVFQKNLSTNPLILPPTSSTALSDPSVFIVNVDPRSRDVYRIGLGVNLLELLKKKPAPGSNVQTPPATNTPTASQPTPAP
jgi:hypothetical protein